MAAKQVKPVKSVILSSKVSSPLRCLKMATDDLKSHISIEVQEAIRFFVLRVSDQVGLESQIFK